jgi:glycosyltransferase involved in cell wall biosynthesis
VIPGWRRDLRTARRPSLEEMTGPTANAVYIVALRTDEASIEPSPPVSARAPIVALLPWGDVFHDFLDALDVTLEEFRDEFTGSWMFGYAAALSTAGVRTLLVCPTTRVRNASRAVHRPTGAGLLFLPAPKGFTSLRRRGLEGRLDGRRDPRSLARAAATHVAPYVATPPLALALHLRRERCDAILCQEYEDPRFDTCVAVGRALRIPVFATFQGADYQLSRLERPLRPLALRACAGLVIGAAAEAERVRRRYGVDGEKIAPIFNPVDLAVWRPLDGADARAELGIPGSASVVAWHGQVQIQRKGLDVLLDAWAQIVGGREDRDLRLLLIGSGEDSQRLRALVAERGLAGVQLIDEWVQSRNRLCELLSAADLYAFPSRHEGLPVSPLEALACGLPVVGADAQGVSDVVGDCGIVVPSGDGSALADALCALLDDRERRSELGLRARARVEERFGLEAVGAQLRAFLVDGRRL